jgi:PEGA domain-containing protein
MSCAMVAALCLGQGGAGCSPAQAPESPTISLRLHGGPRDATVIIDDQTVGTFDFVAARGVALPPGVHHLSVTAQGYFPWDREVEAKPGSQPIRLEVDMAPVPD